MIRRPNAGLVLFLAPLLATAWTFQVSAFAEDAVPSPNPTDTSADSGERIEVTGSHIKRIDTEGASPVETITRKQIDQSGYNSVADILRDETANSFGSLREASGSNVAGNAEISLRGLGSTNTLVLLDGQRLPTDAVDGAVDLNMIPMAAVERIEILKDGASAIYGSDALGGVVNIITRKDFSGTEVSVKEDMPQLAPAQALEGTRTDMSITNGVNTEKMNMVNVITFRNNQGLDSRDRTWSDSNVSNLGDPGSYMGNDGKWHADPNCPPASIVTTPDGTYCGYNTANYSTTLPTLRQFGMMSTVNYDLSSKVKLTARVGGTDRVVNWSYAPAPGEFTLPGSANNGSLPSTTAGQSLDVMYRLGDLGTRDTVATTYAGNVLLGAKYDMGGGWEGDLDLFHNTIYTDNRGVNGYAVTSILLSDISNGTYNPFGTPGNQGSIANAAYIPSEITRSQITTAEAQVSGELFNMPGGAVGVATGAQIAYLDYLDKYDDLSTEGNVFGNAGSNGAGSRSTQAAYTEFSVPVVKNLELQLAGRYDHYSDFGGTFNPKFAALYHVNKKLLFRSSVGWGFMAPLMQQLHAAESDGYQTFIDAVQCSAQQKAGGATPACLPAQYEVISNGNTGLKQETSMSYNVGTVYQATKDLDFSMDWFVTQTRNVVGIDYGAMTEAELQGANLGQQGITVPRDSTTQAINGAITAPLLNLAAQDLSGIDLSVGYRLGRFNAQTDQSELFYFRQTGFPGQPEADLLGTSDGTGAYPKWRNTTTASYSPRDKHTFNLTATTIAAYADAVPSYGNVGRFTQFDLQYVYTMKKSELTFGIVNVLGSSPPLDASSPTQPLNDQLYDQLGRQFIASYKVKF